MNEIKTLLLCGSRIAIPVMRELAYSGQLAAVVIPGKCIEFIGQTRMLLEGRDIPIVIVSKENLEQNLKEVIKTYSPVLGIVFGFSYKLTEAVYRLPAKGFYNIHPGPCLLIVALIPFSGKLKIKKPMYPLQYIK
ncbi:MAG: hypothetical protein QM737_06335 [Ferruginibacter sp.]